MFPYSGHPITHVGRRPHEADLGAGGPEAAQSRTEVPGTRPGMRPHSALRSPPQALEPKLPAAVAGLPEPAESQQDGVQSADRSPGSLRLQTDHTKTSDQPAPRSPPPPVFMGL